MASAKKPRRPLPTGMYRLVDYDKTLLGVRFEMNGRYYDMGISEVSNLLFGDLSSVYKLPCILLEHVGGDFISKAELNGLYTCYDMSSFVEKNLTRLTSFDKNSIRAREDKLSQDFVEKFLTVKNLIENLRSVKGYSGSVMREVDGLGILVRTMTVTYSKTGKPYMIVEILVTGSNRTSSEFLDVLANNNLEAREKALSREDKFVTLIITHKEFSDIVKRFKESVFFNTLHPTIVCKDINGIEVFKFYGSFTGDSLEFSKSPEATKRERKANPELFDTALQFISESFNLTDVVLTTDNLLLNISEELIQSGYLQVQPIDF